MKLKLERANAIIPITKHTKCTDEERGWQELCKNNKEEAYKIMQEQPKAFGFILGTTLDPWVNSEDRKKCIEVVTEFVNKNPDIIDNNPEALKYLRKDYPEYKEKCIATVIKDHRVFNYVQLCLKYKEIVMEIIKNNKSFICHLVENINKIVIDENEMSFININDYRSKDPKYKIVIDIINEDTDIIDYHPKALKYLELDRPDYYEICRAKVKKNGMALEYASVAIRNDYEVVLEAVNKNGTALEFASDEMKNDYKICLAAVTRSGYAYKFTSPKMQNNPEIGLAAVKQYKGVLNSLQDACMTPEFFVMLKLYFKDKIKFNENKCIITSEGMEYQCFLPKKEELKQYIQKNLAIASESIKYTISVDREIYPEAAFLDGQVIDNINKGLYSGIKIVDFFKISDNIITIINGNIEYKYTLNLVLTNKPNGEDSITFKITGLKNSEEITGLKNSEEITGLKNSEKHISSLLDPYKDVGLIDEDTYLNKTLANQIQEKGKESNDQKNQDIDSEQVFDNDQDVSNFKESGINEEATEEKISSLLDLYKESGLIGADSLLE
jgi:hypothetical protein